MYKANQSLTERAYKKEKGDRNFTLFLAIVFLLMITIFIFTRFVYINVRVDGPSMNPTLSSGDVLFANKNAVPEAGDIIVIDGEKVSEDGSGYDLLIKRAIAIGQKDKTIIVQIINNRIWVGDSDKTMMPLSEDYFDEDKLTEPRSDIVRWELNEGDIFYLGDNRENSKDSRSEYGTCKINQVVGVVPEWSLSTRWLSGFIYDLGQFFANLFR